MGKSAKVAISLPEIVLRAVEKERKAKGESRSAFFRRAAERLLNQAHESRASKDMFGVMPPHPSQPGKSRRYMGGSGRAG